MAITARAASAMRSNPMSNVSLDSGGRSSRSVMFPNTASVPSLPTSSELRS
jgi:hypothetical protein